MTAVVLWGSACALPCPTVRDARAIVATLLTRARAIGAHCSRAAPSEWLIDDGDDAGRVTIERHMGDNDLHGFDWIDPDEL